MSDKNSVFDGSPAFPFPSEVSKAAPSGSELARRTGIRPAEPETTGKPVGRPKGSGKSKPKPLTFEKLIELQAERENPQSTGIVFDEKNEAIWKQGTILRIVFENGTEASFCLLSDTQVAPWTVE